MNGKTIWALIWVGLAVVAAFLWGDYQRKAEAQRQTLALSEAIYAEGVMWIEVNAELQVETTTIGPMLASAEPEGKAADLYIGPEAMDAARAALLQQSFFSLARSTLETDQGTEPATFLVVKAPGNPTAFLYVILP